jgi:hypothetical protein
MTLLFHIKIAVTAGSKYTNNYLLADKQHVEW